MYQEQFVESNWEETVETFDGMSLKDEVLRGVYGYGFERPSAIQQKCIRPIILGRDTICQAQAGTGKTATFAIALLQLIDTSVDLSQVLVLFPVRELAQSFCRLIAQLGQYMNVTCHACVGGTVLSNNARTRERAAQVLVGTPGRVGDRILKKALITQRLKLLILDETDEMLCRGFNDQIHEILRRLPASIQVALFSATMPTEILQITDQIMRDPVRVVVKWREPTLEGVKQYYLAIEKDEWKFDTLCDLYETLDILQAVIYCNTRKRVEELTQAVMEKGFNVSSLHGDLDYNTRERAIQEFRTGATRTLISTDLLTSGIDVSHISLVINYDLPPKCEYYQHRIGHRGRFRRTSVINFVTEGEMPFLRELEQHFSTQISEMPLDISEIISN